jgi:hypothetical protein
MNQSQSSGAQALRSIGGYVLETLPPAAGVEVLPALAAPFQAQAPQLISERTLRMVITRLLA